MPADVLSSLATLGITTVEELQALSVLFSHQQREPEELYRTKLSEPDELAFQKWVVHEGIPFDINERNADYDMRGYWDATVKHGINERNVDTGHFPDTWKTPFHRTFSNESIYAPQDAPHWQGKQLIDKHGYVVYDEDDPEDLLPKAAAKLTKDYSSGVNSGKRSIYRQ